MHILHGKKLIIHKIRGSFNDFITIIKYNKVIVLLRVIVMKTTLDVILKNKGSNVVSAKPTDTVYECVLRMNNARIGGLLVMEKNRVVGIFTERDLMTAVVAKNVDPYLTPVSNVMNKNVMCVGPETTTEDAMIIMTEKRVRHLPVIKDSQLLGIVSIGDVTKWLVSSHTRQAQEIDELARYIQGSYSV